MHRILLICVLSGTLNGAPFVVTQGAFDISSGYQTRQINDSPFTNYFAIRPASTNFIFVNDYPSSFTLESSFSVTNNWQGNYGGWTVNTNITRDVISLHSGTGSFSLQLTNLYPGLYGIQIFGVVTNTVALDAWRPSLLWKIQANDALDGSTNTYHLIQNYISGTNYDICQFWVQAIRNAGPSNNILVTVSLDAASEVNCKVVSLHFFAPVDWSDTNVYKTNATLFTAEEQAARVVYWATNMTAGTELNWRSNSPSLPTLSGSTLTNIFNRWLPLNQMFDEASGVYASPVHVTNEWFPAPYQVNAQNYYSDYSSPWGWTNIITTSAYSLANTLTGALVPGTTNDYNGFYYTNGTWVSSYGSYQSYGLYRNFLLAAIENVSGTSLPYRFYTFPSQTNSAHTAGLILAKIAVTYPSYRLEALDINSNVKNPSAYLDYEYGRWSLRRTGKLEYDGWAGISQPFLAEAMDYLWPYVSTSSAFASDLTKFLPWIGGNTNNVKLLFDSHMLRGLAFDAGYRSRGGDPMQLGLVMQSGTISSNFMNPSESVLEVTPATTASMSWKKQYAGTYNQDGVNLIGSSFYMVGENALLNGPDFTRRYLANGGQVGTINISQATNYPKLQSFVDYYANQSIGWGYSASFGDAAMSINEGPGVENGVNDAFLVALWRLKNNARLGKYIVDVRGRSTQTDAEWSAMQSQSASESWDIRYPTQSRVLSGVGIGILEQGLGVSNQIQRGAVVLRTVSGYGHDHGDHLDLNIYSLGSRMGTDFGERNEGANVVYPNDTSTRMHNVIEVDGYNHVTSAANGWPGGNTEGGYSQYTAFSTNGSSQMIGADLWNGTAHANVTYQHRDIALVKVDETNSYTVDFQRVHGGRFYSWSFHGADVGGETAGFTSNQSLTNVTDYTDITATSPGFFMRKHTTNSAYSPMAGTSTTNKIVAEWRLGRTATAAGSLLNADGNGGTVTAIASEQAMFGSSYSSGSPRKITRMTLFDRTNDFVGIAWAFSPLYNILQPRIYVFTPGTTYYSNLTERSGTYVALYDPYMTSRYISAESSLATDSALTNAWQPKMLEVTSTAGTDRHYSSATNVDVVSGGDTWNGTYAFTRDSNSVPVEFKLVGGTKLVHGGFTLTPTTNNISVSISSVNWTNMTLILAAAFPVRKVGWYRFRNSTHETSYYISSWSSPSNATFIADPLCGELDVSSVSGNTITFTGAEGGMVLASYPKRGTGITLANEARSKVVKVDYAASTTATRTSGDSISTGDFTDADGDGHVSAFLYDFGPGDTLEIPSEVYLRKVSPSSYLVSANIGFTFSGFDGSWAINGNSLNNGVVQQSFLTGELQNAIPSGGVLNIGTLYLR